MRRGHKKSRRSEFNLTKNDEREIHNIFRHAKGVVVSYVLLYLRTLSWLTYENRLYLTTSIKRCVFVHATSPAAAFLSVFSFPFCSPAGSSCSTQSYVARTRMHVWKTWKMDGLLKSTSARVAQRFRVSFCSWWRWRFSFDRCFLLGKPDRERDIKGNQRIEWIHTLTLWNHYQ